MAPDISIRALQADDAPASKRLHKYAKLEGERIFPDEAGLNEMLDAACAGAVGTFGLVALASCAPEPELVGVLTAQWEEAEAGAAGQAGATGTAGAAGARRSCVLLTLVIRADVRGGGVGRALLSALRVRLQEGHPAGPPGGDGLPVRLLTDVAVANEPAVAFFKRQGFRQAGRSNGRSVELTVTARQVLMALAFRGQQAGASTSAPGVQHQRPSMTPFRPRHGPAQPAIRCASSQSPTQGPKFTRSAQEAAEQLLRKAQSFAQEQKLEQRASAAVKQAGEKAGEAAEAAKVAGKRLFVKLDSEYDLTQKSARAAKRAEEAARDIDQQYGVRRRLRSAREYVVRMLPTWQRQLDEFTGTWYGKTAVFAGICLLVSTPIFWSFVNLALLLWWLSIPLSIMLLDYARKQQAQRLQQQEAEEAEAARRAAQNPFAEMFRGAFDARRSAGAAGGRGGRTGGGAGGGGGGRGSFTQDGPVIDAEWTSLDEGGKPKGPGRRR
ncbi:hypothetical protein TSOC_007420 [Tetrabaena socialis]|uniref:N-acetyltransferase domain-containing protein n=1 Tax=Tetrabaena socialis TaxID=47790 RepID=A0A2J8A154_9CHLO|nr:hypothetical protein TSOC_007420 [Tetrabaena socialis]|eukprot:PNH06244.1 hypothetical protein TSOC_007420 [Tetrabaena socialis]